MRTLVCLAATVSMVHAGDPPGPVKPVEVPAAARPADVVLPVVKPIELPTTDSLADAPARSYRAVMVHRHEARNGLQHTQERLEFRVSYTNRRRGDALSVTLDGLSIAAETGTPRPYFFDARPDHARLTLNGETKEFGPSDAPADVKSTLDVLGKSLWLARLDAVGRPLRCDRTATGMTPLPNGTKASLLTRLFHLHYHADRDDWLAPTAVPVGSQDPFNCGLTVERLCRRGDRVTVGVSGTLPVPVGVQLDGVQIIAGGGTVGGFSVYDEMAGDWVEAAWRVDWHARGERPGGARYDLNVRSVYRLESLAGH